MVPASITADTGDLQQLRWGLRFSEPSTEARYRFWQIEKAVPFTRVGMFASLLGWALLLCATPTMMPSDRRLVFGLVLLVVYPVTALCLATTYRPGLLRWMLPGAALANATGGLVGVVMCFGFIQARPDLSMGVVSVIAYFGFTILRLNPAQAALAVGSYVSGHLSRLAAGYLAGEVTLDWLVEYSVLPVVAFSTGFLACLAINRVSREAYRQERVIDAQRQVIEHERTRVEQLLHSILPAAIADRLKENRKVIADRFENVTVLFADLVGFTPMAARLTPEGLVAILNDIFTRFDALAARHGVEKIKTIGDAYMAVAGMPREQPDHAGCAASMALAMRGAIDEYNTQHQLQIHLRIGLASGAVVAGVIGATKFAYDLWGDTVNTAARMESHSPEGGIQVAESTWLKLVDRFVFEDRGMIDVKGKGPMRTWMLLDQRRSG